MTADKFMLQEKIGKLSKTRIHQIIDGISLVINPTY
jgi:hypothetical protein